MPLAESLSLSDVSRSQISREKVGTTAETSLEAECRVKRAALIPL